MFDTVIEGVYVVILFMDHLAYYLSQTNVVIVMKLKSFTVVTLFITKI